MNTDEQLLHLRNERYALEAATLDIAKDRGIQARVGREIDDIFRDDPEYAKRFPQDAIDVQIEEQEAWEAECDRANEQQHLDKWGLGDK